MKKNEIWFARKHADAKIPSKRDEDAGYDIYPAFDKPYIKILPHETVKIPTGLHSAFSNKYVMILKERGSTGTKGIGQRCGIIDSGYRGEWLVPITNHNDIPLYIIKEGVSVVDLEKDVIAYPYDKAIAQAICVKVPKMEIKEKFYEEVCAVDSQRKDGKLGSSGK